MPEGGAYPAAAAELLIVGRSARALAASADAAGIRCDVMDEFLDSDTRSLAQRAWPIRGGLSATTLAPLLDDWRQQCAPGALILPASGFESVPGLLEWLSRYAPVAGNAAAVVRRIKDPAQFFPLLDRLGIPHPPIRLAPSADCDGWLCKPAGGEGGLGIAPWSAGQPLPPGCYLQQRIEGRSRSVVFLADGCRARIVGVNECRTAGELFGDADDFRFAEVVRMASDGAFERRLAEMLERLVAASGLRGLCGMDLVEHDGKLGVLEINPRPPASFELHENGNSLVAAHRVACEGRLPAWPAASGQARGKRVVYCTEPVRIPNPVGRPTWAADRPLAGSRLEAGMPLCTIFAQAATVPVCRQQLQRRHEELINNIKINCQAVELEDNILRKEVIA